MVRLHTLLFAPWIVLSIPTRIFAGLSIPVVLIVVLAGLIGTLAKKQAMTIFASVSLLIILVFGKVGEDLLGAAIPDTAILLVQFLGVIFFMEASRVVLSFDKALSELRGKTDAGSLAIREKLSLWVRRQIVSQARLTVGALGASLTLLVFGGVASVSINQLSFLAVLVLLVVGVLLFLLTQQRQVHTTRRGLRGTLHVNCFEIRWLQG